MDQNKPPIKPIAYNFGIYLGLLTIASLVILYVLNIESHWIASVLSTIATIVIFFYGINTYKKQNANVLSIKDGLKTGMAMALIGGLISAIYAAIHYAYVMPEFLLGKKEEAYNQMMQQNPNMNGEQLEMATKMLNISTSEFFIATMMLLGSLFFGFIVSLIISAILKNDR
ncbi:DUF4199 domain-containing protein [Winogradskyella eckloniae]|uniref:DUF4199 domain-containing protein n=1 Tax=Winogradskyella eckloniae TaxID=1089306 RepID=UPI001567AE7C|nr:DUF4199 domain-containing protein [Winogradskyella eckloniae]NRD19750.1 DUF4199 domain-containing protein [Winogradskyella eckloniae]